MRHVLSFSYLDTLEQCDCQTVELPAIMEAHDCTDFTLWAFVGCD